MFWTNLTTLFAGSVEALREAASSGDVAAQYRLGRMYETGRRVSRNEGMAALWYRRAADRGHAEAQFRLGLMYASGRGLARDPEKAARRLRDAAEQGVSAAKRHLALLTKAIEQAPFSSEQMKWTDKPKAATQAPFPPEQMKWAGKPQAHRELMGFILIAGLIILIVGLIQIGTWMVHVQRVKTFKQPQNTPRTESPRLSGTARHYLRLAEQGDAEAQQRLGRLYDRGSEGLPQDNERAVYWYRKAALQNHVFAQYHLGWMYEHGRGVPRDRDQARFWYEKAAGAGFQNAAKRLLELESQVQDLASRLARLRQAASQGDAEAQYRLGLHFEQGDDCPRDDEQATLWFRKSAEQGHVKAQLAMGRLSDYGKGVSPDHAQAAVWYRRAAEQGNTEAQYVLGWKYAQGQGLPQDENLALEWYRKAAAQGHGLAQKRLKALEERRTGR